MILHTFSEFISNITDTFRELLPNNITHFSRHQTILTFSESYWQTILQTFFQISYHYQTILTFSENYWQIILHTFPDFISLSDNIVVFGELPANNTIHFSRVYI